MLKKILLGIFFVGLSGVLVGGAIMRTTSRLDQVAEAANNGQGRGQNRSTTLDNQANGTGNNGQGNQQNEASGGQGNGNGGQGNGGGSGQGNGGERQYPAYDDTIVTLETVSGSVVQAPAAGEDLVLLTTAGEELVVGAGPTQEGDAILALTVGDQLEIDGYWEAGEFKATRILRPADGLSITLRDESGRPNWAGNNGNGGGNNGAAGNGDQTGTGQAQVDAWLEIDGAVVSVDENTLAVEAANGEVILMENRAWWFVLDQGFVTEPGDQLRLIGFYEDGDFEVGRIDNLSSGATVLVRDENGRPLWAGGGRGAGNNS